MISFVTLATIIFMNYPPPDLSSRLKDWYKKGLFYKYGDFSVFYVGKNLKSFFVDYIVIIIMSKNITDFPCLYSDDDMTS